MHTPIRTLTTLLIIAATALAPRAAQSACAQWDLSRVAEWVLNQHNGFYIWVTFQQHDISLGGRARYQSQGYQNPQGSAGNLIGTVRGNVVDFTVNWDGGGSGIYSGTVQDDGSMAGQTRDAAGGPSAGWHAEQGAAVCVAEAAAQPIPPSNPEERPLQGGDQLSPLDALLCGMGWFRGADGQCYPILK